MKFRIFTILLLSIISCNSKSTKKDTEQTPNYEVATNFIKEYNGIYNSIDSVKEIIPWIKNRQDVSEDFKIILEMTLADAYKKDPDYGLGFDPIINAQDFPENFEVIKKEGNYITIQGVEWNEFQLTMKLVKEGDTWLVDGSGVINMPEEK